MAGGRRGRPRLDGLPDRLSSSGPRGKSGLLTKLKGHDEDADVERLLPHGAIVGIDYDTIDADTGTVSAKEIAQRPDRALPRQGMAAVGILTVFVFLWAFRRSSRGSTTSIFKFPLAGLHNEIAKVPPVVAKQAPRTRRLYAELAVSHRFRHLLAAVIGGLLMGYSPLGLSLSMAAPSGRVRWSLLTIAAAGAWHSHQIFRHRRDAGFGFRAYRLAYPLFGTMLGWLGVALPAPTPPRMCCSAACRRSPPQLGLNPCADGGCQPSGGVMGKMIDAQSIVVASTATVGRTAKDRSFAYVFFHSIALAILVGILVMLQAL